jgi:succinate dehydrogenase / fumarate reductase cytochrome b subunit
LQDLTSGLPLQQIPNPMATVQAGLFRSSLGRKYFMALSGLFLCLFLVVHLAGNLQLFMDDGGKAFNVYTWFMTHNPLIKVVSYVNYAMILLHVVDGLMLSLQNRKARPVGYYKVDQSKSSTWSSRNMGILGTIILIFLVVHLKTFWFEMHFGSVPVIQYDEDGILYKDLFTIVDAAFSQWWYALLYIISMFALSFHLYHGFQSGFQSLGINHPRYTKWIKGLGLFAFAILIPALFAAMPLYFFLLNL